MKFRKRPVVIEAVQLRWDNWSEMCEHAGVGSLSDGKPEGTQKNPATGETLSDSGPGLLIPTLEGVMLGMPGDWIIKDVRGELYPCKPDIFEATYEPVSAEESREAKALRWVLGIIKQWSEDSKFDLAAPKVIAEARRIAGWKL